MKYAILVQGHGGSKWWEEYDGLSVVSIETAKEAGLHKVAFFNRTLRPGETPRRYIRCAMVENAGPSQAEHDWQKKNLVTLKGNGLMYDLYECSQCGCQAKRYGLSNSFSRFGKWDKPKYAHCEGAQ